MKATSKLYLYWSANDKQLTETDERQPLMFSKDHRYLRTEYMGSMLAQSTVRRIGQALSEAGQLTQIQLRAIFDEERRSYAEFTKLTGIDYARELYHNYSEEAEK